MGAYKTVEVKATIRDCLDVSEIQSLSEEMSEWRDNLDGTALENTQKYEEVSECADTLESAASDLESSLEDVIEAIDDWRPELLTRQIAVREDRSTRKARGPSRAVRLSNAITAIQTAEQAIRDEADKPAREGEGDELIKAQAVLDALEEIESPIGDVEGVDFPGMY